MIALIRLWSVGIVGSIDPAVIVPTAGVGGLLIYILKTLMEDSAQRRQVEAKLRLEMEQQRAADRKEHEADIDRVRQIHQQEIEFMKRRITSLEGEVRRLRNTLRDRGGEVDDDEPESTG